MKANSKLLMSCLLGVAIGFIWNLNSNSFYSNAYSDLIVENQTTTQFADYKKWLQVNKKPLMMQSNISLLCAPASAAQQKDNSPHKDKFLVVYVNQTAQKAMMEEMHPKFLQGSVIIKEKLTSENNPSPELLTAMIKREKGFNPAANDWEFFVLGGDAKSIQAQGKLDNCLACHAARRNDDFVFRNYLPKDVLMKLKD
jgi:hypothetical protein